MVIQDLLTKRKIGGGYESNGIYYFDNAPSLVACFAAVSPLQIHYHLSHPSLDNLKRLVASWDHVKSLELRV